MSQDQGGNQNDSAITQGLAVAGGGTIFGGGIVAAILAKPYRIPILIFLAVALVLVLVAGVLFLLLRSRRRKLQAKGLGNDVTGEFDRQAAASNDQDLKARLEKMKRKFMVLVETLRQEGHKNIYEMPWFLTLGPSGSGKSWVLKGSGLNQLDETDWKRGTFLIDWWSGNDAIVLDTAGGVVFREDKGYDSPEWRSLLNLLKKHRPECPINGLLVMIPAQLLWLKPEELPQGWLSLDDYANALKFQIRKRLQRDLGIRFPVYFLVTQTDRVPGFREFADALQANGQPVVQMVGWSIPVEVGKKPFKSPNNAQTDPELEEINNLDQRIRNVAADLRRKRMELLRRFVGDGARADEVGMGVRRRAAELFAFSDAIQSTLAPRLHDFLVKVFSPEPMLPKMPPYLRGVYFTSSLREGEVLDRQRAGVGRLATLALPGGADNEQPNPFFLKDLIVGKAFLESWLVTPLVEARAYLKHRQRTLLLSGIAAGMALLVAIAIGGWGYSRTVGNELAHWSDASESARTNNRYWLPIIKSEAIGFQLDQNNLLKQIELAKAASGVLEHGGFWSFSWLFGTRNLDKSRRDAQLHLFERGVILPLSDFAKQRILSSINEADQYDEIGLTNETQRFEAAFVGVLELELCPSNHSWKTPEWEASRDRVVDGLMNYLLADLKGEIKSAAIGKLKVCFDNTYQKRQNLWPPLLTKQPEAITNFVTTAFAKMTLLQSKRSSLFEEQRKRLSALLKDTWAVKVNEESLIAGIESRDDNESLAGKLTTLRDHWSDVQNRLNSEHIRTFGQAFTNYARSVRAEAEGRQDTLIQRIRLVTGATAGGTNLIGVLAQGFEQTTKDIPRLETIVAQFQSMTNHAAIVDTSMLPWSAVSGKEGQSDAEMKWRLQQRIESYGQIIDIAVPATDACERDLFVDAKEAKDVIENFEKSARACPLATSAFAGLTNGTVPYTTSVSQYLVFRYFEELLKRGQSRMPKILAAQKYSITSSSFSQPEPKDIFDDAKTAQSALKRLDDVWSELQRKWTDLGGTESASIRNSRKAISAKSESLYKTVKKQIIDASSAARGFPLEEAESGLSPAEVVDGWNQATAWKKAFLDCEKGQNSIPDSTRKDWFSTITNWVGSFHTLVNDKGEILRYQIGTPWTDLDRSAFESCVGAERVREAEQGAAKYKAWEFGGRTLKADDVKQGLAQSADRGFAIKTRPDETGGAYGRIKTATREQNWTIIDLIRRDDLRCGAPPYFVPIDVEGEKGPARVWFVIRPVEARTPH